MVLLVCIGLFVFYVLADRYIPSTDMARVRGYVIPVTPLVSGRVVDVMVEPNDVVQPGAPWSGLTRQITSWPFRKQNKAW